MSQEVYLGNPNLKKANTPIEFTEDQIMASYDWRSDKTMRINKILNS